MANTNQPSAKPAPIEPPEHRPAGFPWKTIVVIAIVVAGIAALAVWRHNSGGSQSKQGPTGRGGAAAGPVTAVIGTVQQKDFPIYLDGLGTVQAFNTVTIRSRVDGQLQQLAFAEGQEVHAGDLLAQIDPAPFKTQVAQAEAKKLQDEAQLENANIDLRRNAVLLTNKIVAPEVYDTAKALVRQLEAGVKADEAAIDNANVQLAYTTIKAPIDGRA